MTGSDVVFDTWAWWEVLHATATGRRLQATYLAKGRVHSSAYVLAELAAKLADAGLHDQMPGIAQRIAAAGPVVPVDGQLAQAAGILRAELRKKAPAASLADALMLATARRLRATLVSGDAAFRGQPDVRR